MAAAVVAWAPPASAGSPRAPDPAPLAFVDPALPRAGGGGRRLAIEAQLSRAVEQYRRRWSRLPRVRVGPGPIPRRGDVGPRVAALRGRLGLPKDGGFDAGLMKALAAFQAVHGLPGTGTADAATVAALDRDPADYEAKILANLERARALPPLAGSRYILVNIPNAVLQLHENGRVRLEMPVVVGKPEQPTPEMAGLLRYAVFNPYWNVPEDLVRDQIAPQALEDPGRIARRGFEVMTDWSPAARRLARTEVDWRAAAAGRISLRVRQRPGPDNVMGRVKFMLPNPLGIYLHDYPDRSLFGRPDRRLSAGCIRLGDARALALALVGRAPGAADGPVDARVDLSAPVPVYITYFTVAPGPDGPRFLPDVYGRDDALILRMAATARAAA